MHRRLQFWPDAGRCLGAGLKMNAQVRGIRASSWSLEPAPRKQCTAAWHVRIKVRIKLVVCRMTAQPCGILVSNRSFAQLRGYNQRVRLKMCTAEWHLAYKLAVHIKPRSKIHAQPCGVAASSKSFDSI